MMISFQTRMSSNNKHLSGNVSFFRANTRSHIWEPYTKPCNLVWGSLPLFSAGLKSFKEKSSCMVCFQCVVVSSFYNPIKVISGVLKNAHGEGLYGMITYGTVWPSWFFMIYTVCYGMLYKYVKNYLDFAICDVITNKLQTRNEASCTD